MANDGEYINICTRPSTIAYFIFAIPIIYGFKDKFSCPLREREMDEQTLNNVKWQRKKKIR